MARFFGFPNPQTWLVYHELTHNHRVATLHALVEAFELENGPACDRLAEAVREALRPAMKEDHNAAFLLADSLITQSLSQVVWGELLVALRWHFVGNPISSQSNGASNRETPLTTQKRHRVSERSIIKDAIDVELS